MIDHKGVENGVRERYGVKGEGERRSKTKRSAEILKDRDRG